MNSECRIIRKENGRNFLAGKQSLSNIRLGSEKKQVQDDRRGQPGWKREEEDEKASFLFCAVGR